MWAMCNKLNQSNIENTDPLSDPFIIFKPNFWKFYSANMDKKHRRRLYSLQKSRRKPNKPKIETSGLSGLLHLKFKS
jgi:hypothetical protein